MTHRTYSIGEASRLSGVSVRRLRFYSDQGLLPPAGRTESGYRVFTDSELVRLDLIRCLRDAGLGLDAIREVLSKELSLTEALTLRLRAIEAEIAAQRRIAAALRAALRSPELTEADLRRFWTMTKLSRDERRSVVEAFYERVSDGVNIDPKWMRQMIEDSVPELPEDPTPAQCDAWIELSDMLNDPGFAANMRSNAKDIWDDATFDPKAWQIEGDALLVKARTPSPAAWSLLRRPATHWQGNGWKPRPGSRAGSLTRISAFGCVPNMRSMTSARLAIGSWLRSCGANHPAAARTGNGRGSRKP
jgi:DNA-binding transcriptional MerR regulator